VDSISVTQRKVTELRRAAQDVPRPSELGAISSNAFKAIFASFPGGVTIVTTTDLAGAPIGVTVSAVMSLSLKPPQLLISLASSKYTMRMIEAQEVFTVNFLAAQQHAISDRFATAMPDKFAGVDWYPGAETGAPVLAGVRAHAECRTEALIRAGDHTLVVGRIVAGDTSLSESLVYCDRQYATLSAISHKTPNPIP
jgi:flavin reductase (DIM6/NTAB) family NADH-FMN oxidoreductase RutF